MRAAHCFHAKESEAARQFATHHLRMTLDGKVSYVLRNLRRLLDEKKKDLAAKKRKTLRAAITYFENNQDQFVNYRIQAEQAALYGPGTVYSKVADYAQAA